MDTTEKISYLDGLRGVAAINVLIMHFFIVLAPALIYTSRMPARLGTFEQYFTETPLGLIGAGNFSVCIFFVLSGYVLTQKYFNTKDKNIILSSALRRYIRLFIPVLAVIIFSFLLASNGAFHYYIEAVAISGNNNYANYWTFTPNIINALKTAVWGTFFAGDDTYNPVLWTMKIEFYGSMLVFAMALVFGSLRNRWTLYMASALIFFNTYYLAFIIGIALADAFSSKSLLFSTLKTENKTILLGILILGLFLGSYPMDSIKSDSIYAFLNNGLFQNPRATYHIIGASIVMYALLNSQGMQKIFSSPLPVFLGKISYSLYLIHFLIISTFTCALFLILYPILPYSLAVFVSCFISLILIIPLSYLFYKYIDLTGLKLSKLFYNWIARLWGVDSLSEEKKEHSDGMFLMIYNKYFK
jgi:peptidoglycan/LPS O-acetylase OafA/YrhL